MPAEHLHNFSQNIPWNYNIISLNAPLPPRFVRKKWTQKICIGRGNFRYTCEQESPPVWMQEAYRRSVWSTIYAVLFWMGEGGYPSLDGWIPYLWTGSTPSLGDTPSLDGGCPSHLRVPRPSCGQTKTISKIFILTPSSLCRNTFASPIAEASSMVDLRLVEVSVPFVPRFHTIPASSFLRMFLSKPIRQKIDTMSRPFLA